MTAIYLALLKAIRGSGAVVAHHLAKVRVAGSSPVFRSVGLLRDARESLPEIESALACDGRITQK